MGTFAEMMGKAQRQDSESRTEAKLALMKKYGISQDDLDAERWEFRETGPFGQTEVKLYKLVETTHVKIEGLVRAVVSSEAEPE